jgi:hypothetical protein
MELSELRARVEARVQQELAPSLFERYKKHHMKRNWRTCDCSYCDEKRGRHAALQFAPYHLRYEDKIYWRNLRIQHTREALFNEEQRVIT